MDISDVPLAFNHRHAPTRLFLPCTAALTLTFLAAAPALAAQSPQQSPSFDMAGLLAASLAWLVPAGFALLAAAGTPAERAWQTALAGVAGASLGVLAFYAVGFSLAFGGIGLVYPQARGLDGLIWEWTLLAGQWGTKWGMAGLAGWALSGPASTPEAYTLFFANLPWVATAALVPLAALRGRTPPLSSLLGGLLVGGLLFPVAMNWVWGGGWLANIGENLNLGHGFVDFAGAGTVHLVAGATALAGVLAMLPRRPRQKLGDGDAVELPPVHLPLLASMGALLILAGSLGWAWANPLLNWQDLLPMRGVINAVLVAVSGALAPLAYTWFVADRPDPLMAAKGLAAGAVAGAAVGPFIPPWAAIALGLLAGLLVPLLTYLIRELLRVADDTSTLAVHVAGSLLGLAAIGFVADGLAGAGWNGVGQVVFLGVRGQGVTGLLAAPGMQPDWPGQMQAQVIGMAALFLMPLLAGLVVFGLLAVLAKGLNAARATRRSAAPALAAAVAPEAAAAEQPEPADFESIAGVADVDPLLEPTEA